MSSTAPPQLSRLERIARRPRPSPSVGDDEERCELCAAPLSSDHPHLLDLSEWNVRCACRACGVLFDRQIAGGGKLRRIPDRRWRFADLRDDDLVWAAFGIPVDLAFFVDHGDGRVVAYFPGPAGITQAEVDTQTWAELLEANPVLARIEPDVEALLVRQQGETRHHFLVPIDDCFRLVALMRQSWQGFSGGTAVWAQLDDYFDRLAQRSKQPPNSTKT